MTELPLASVQVVCIAIYVPALVAAQRLRQAGARVSVIEPPGGDPLAQFSSAWYAELHEGCDTRRLDLKANEGAAACDALLATADVLLTALRPSALARLHLDWATLHARHPRLCQVAIVGFAGADAEHPGHDLTYQAEAGVLTPPIVPPVLLADTGGGIGAALAATSLLVARSTDGAGRYAEVSLAEAATWFAAPRRHGVTAPDGVLGGALPEYRLYRASDGWVAVAALEPYLRDRLHAALAERGTAPERGGLEHVFPGESVAYWDRWGREHALPITAVRTP